MLENGDNKLAETDVTLSAFLTWMLLCVYACEPRLMTPVSGIIHDAKTCSILYTIVSLLCYHCEKVTVE